MIFTFLSVRFCGAHTSTQLCNDPPGTAFTPLSSRSPVTDHPDPLRGVGGAICLPHTPRTLLTAYRHPPKQPGVFSQVLQPHPCHSVLVRNGGAVSWCVLVPSEKGQIGQGLCFRQRNHTAAVSTDGAPRLHWRPTPAQPNYTLATLHPRPAGGSRSHLRLRICSLDMKGQAVSSAAEKAFLFGFNKCLKRERKSCSREWTRSSD